MKQNWTLERSRQYARDRYRADPAGAAKAKTQRIARLEKKAGRLCPAVCDICREPNIPGKRLAFDHDHATGKFRGWLCDDCNTTLGKVHDDVVLLHRMVVYLATGGSVFGS